MLEVEWNFSSAETSSSNQGGLRKNELKDAPQERSLRNKCDRSLAQELEIINLDDLEIAYKPKKMARTGRSTTLTKII